MYTSPEFTAGGTGLLLILTKVYSGRLRSELPTPIFDRNPFGRSLLVKDIVGTTPGLHCLTLPSFLNPSRGFNDRVDSFYSDR